jgi:Mg/Co/Ni transporter MgtE
MKKTLKFASEHLFDFLGFAAILAIVHGVAMIHKPSAWIVGGALALAFSVFVSYFEAMNKK